MQTPDGDLELADRLRAALGPRHDVAAVATLAGATTRLAAVGATTTADFELGSLSKGITGLLHADALTRGEIGPTTTLGDLLPLAGTPAARLTLASVSTHRSGLPRLPRSARLVRGSYGLWRHGTNPYGEDLDTLLEQARRTRVGPAAPRYSNLGFQLLGHALAAAAGTGYTDLVQQRLARPLGLSGLYAPAGVDELRPGALMGRSRRGRPRSPWTGEALAPAGGLRAPVSDLARLARALLDGTAPGCDALRPVAPFGRGAAVGAGWFTSTGRPHRVTWHDGATGGFASWLGLDLDAGTAVVVLTATAAPVVRQGFALLADLSGPPTTG